MGLNGSLVLTCLNHYIGIGQNSNGQRLMPVRKLFLGSNLQSIFTVQPAVFSSCLVRQRRPVLCRLPDSVLALAAVWQLSAKPHLFLVPMAVLLPHTCLH